MANFDGVHRLGFCLSGSIFYGQVLVGSSMGLGSKDLLEVVRELCGGRGVGEIDILSWGAGYLETRLRRRPSTVCHQHQRSRGFPFRDIYSEVGSAAPSLSCLYVS